MNVNTHQCYQILLPHPLLPKNERFKDSISLPCLQRYCSCYTLFSEPRVSSTRLCANEHQAPAMDKDSTKGRQSRTSIFRTGRHVAACHCLSGHVSHH